MNTTNFGDAGSIENFRRRVGDYIQDNARYFDALTPEAALEHWDTNGFEGIGDELSGEERREFLAVAPRLLADWEDKQP